MEKKFMYVDDIAVELNGEKNVLEVIRKETAEKKGAEA